MSNSTKIPTPEAFGMPASADLVYVRSVSVADLDPEIETPEGVETLYAVHDEAGRRLALFDNRDFAFAIAKQHDLTALSAH